MAARVPVAREGNGAIGVAALLAVLFSGISACDAPRGSHASGQAEIEAASSAPSEVESRDRKQALAAVRSALAEGRFDDAVVLLDPLLVDGSPEAHFLKARAYIEGWQTRRDYVSAYPHARIAAEHGFASAQRLLADMYAYGYGVTPDPARAAHWAYLASRAETAADPDRNATDARDGAG